MKKIFLLFVLLIGCKSQLTNPEEVTWEPSGVWQSTIIQGYAETKTQCTLLVENNQITGSINSDCFGLFGTVSIPFTIYNGILTKANNENLYDISIDAKMQSMDLTYHLRGNVKDINGVKTIVAHVSFETSGIIYGTYPIHLVQQSINYLPKKHDQGIIN